MKTGKTVIGIDKKVYFEPDGLEKPDKRRLLFAFIIGVNTYNSAIKKYNKELKEYEASKRLVEVSNVFWGELSEEWLYDGDNEGLLDEPIIKDNLPCKAEVTGDKAKIIELIK